MSDDTKKDDIQTNSILSAPESNIPQIYAEVNNNANNLHERSNTNSNVNEHNSDLVADITAHSRYLDEHPTVIENTQESQLSTDAKKIKESPSVSSNISSVQAIADLAYVLDVHDPVQDTDDQFEHVNVEHEEEFQLIPHLNDEKHKWMIWMPIIFWLPRYKWKKWLPADLIAGLTNLVMLIPQGMGYALVAGLPVKHGIYSSLLGPLLYFPFGTSGQMSVAAMAVAALMVFQTVTPFVDPSNEEKYAAYCACLAFQVGCIQLLMGIVRAGVLANMLAKPVMVGFTAAAGVLISMSQMKFMFGVEVEGTEFLVQIASLIRNLPNTHGMSVLTTLVFLAFLLFLKHWQSSDWPLSKYVKFVPSAFVAVTIGTLSSYAVGTSSGFDIIGSLDNGLPAFKNFFTLVEEAHFWSMWVNSTLIALLIFIENYSVTMKFSEKHDYSINPSQELLALGVCNLVGSWWQILPIGGAMSRCAVIEAAGSKTPLNSCIAGVLMLFCSLFLLTLFKWLPKPVLAGIVLAGILGLFDYKMMILLWKLKKKDFYVMVCTILITLFLGIGLGVAVGVVASVVVFIQHAAKPHYGILGKLPSVVVGDHATHSIYRNIKHHPEALLRRDMLIIRWDASLFFANINSFKKRIRKHIGRFLIKNDFPKPWCLALCFSGVNDIDSSACVELRAFFIELQTKQKDMTLLIAKLKTEVLLLLDKADVVSVVGKDNFLLEVHQAELWWEDYLNNRRHLLDSNGTDENKVQIVYSRFSGASVLFPATELQQVKTNEDLGTE